jgi:hypothetical protein
VAAGGGVVSSASALVGNNIDAINESKSTSEKMVFFFVVVIAVAPSHPGSKHQAETDFSVMLASGMRIGSFGLSILLFGYMTGS